MKTVERCLYVLVVVAVGGAVTFLLRFGYDVLDVILYPYK